MSIPTAQPTTPIITQVSPIINTQSLNPNPDGNVENGAGASNKDGSQDEIMNETICLNARGTLIHLTRHELARLPQCILVGIAASLQQQPLPQQPFASSSSSSAPPGPITSVSPGGVGAAAFGSNINAILMADPSRPPVIINYPPKLLQYTLDTFRQLEHQQNQIQLQRQKKDKAKQQKTAREGDDVETVDLSEIQGYNDYQEDQVLDGQLSLAEAIQKKAAVIVLREDLDFYCLPPLSIPVVNKGGDASAGSNRRESGSGISKTVMNRIKREAGRQLVLYHNYVFEGLQNSIDTKSAKKAKKTPKTDADGSDDYNGTSNETTASPETHLIDMLCSTGFNISQKWGYRQMENENTVVTSLALVRLRTDGANEGEGKKDEEEKEKDSKNSTLSSNDTFVTADAGSSVSNVPDGLSSSIYQSQEQNDAGDTGGHPNLQGIPSDAGLAGEIDESGVRGSDNVDDDDDDRGSQGTKDPAVDLAKSQKLFLFWKKPARKCWWDAITLDSVKVNLNENEGGGDGTNQGDDGKVDVGPIKVHLRSVWTLELCIVD